MPSQKEKKNTERIPKTKCKSAQYTDYSDI